RPVGAPAPAPAPGPIGPPPIPQAGPSGAGAPPPISPFAPTQQGPVPGQPGPIPGQPGPGGPVPPGGFQPSGQSKSKLPLILGLGLGAVVVIGGLIAAAVVLGGDDDDEPLAATDTTAATTDEADDATADGATADPTEDPATDEGTTSDQAPIGDSDEVGDVISCTRVDSDTITLEVVNSSPNTSSYFMTVAFFDDGGQRLADEIAFVNYLRPGERAIENQFTFEEQGSTCEVIEVDRILADSTDAELGDVGPCELSADPDFAGDFQASLVATNSSSETFNYVVDVAFVDPDGVRRGTGSAFIDAVRPGESAPSDVFSTTDFAPGYTCAVVAVSRNTP
ncbi:MAG: hypothetical protein AAF962_26795, partial [Actinomycetota bacterium]